MFSYMIVVNDNGELKTVSRDEVEEAVVHFEDPVTGLVRVEAVMDEVLNWVLDRKSEQEEENAAILERATELPDPERD